MAAPQSSPFWRYAVVGLLATAVHYALLVLAVAVGQWPAWLAAGLGATVGAQVGYLGNLRFTFRAGGARMASWWRFMATALLGIVLTMATVALGVALGLHYLLAQVLATGLVLLLTYAINRRWTFASRPDPG